MPGPLATAALVKGGQAVGGYLFNKFFGKKPTDFKKTPYGQLLTRRSEEGIYSPGVRREIVGRVGREAGNIAANAAASYRGRLISKGIGGSIAGERGLGEIMTKPIDAVSRTQRDIDLQNELSKVRASETLAIGQTGYEQALKDRENRLRGELVGGLVDAGGSYLTGRANEEAFAGINFDDPKSVQNWIAGQPDQAKAIDMLTRMAQSQYYQRYGQQGGSVDFSLLNDMELQEAMQWWQDWSAKNPELAKKHSGIVGGIIGTK